MAAMTVDDLLVVNWVEKVGGGLLSLMVGRGFLG